MTTTHHTTETTMNETTYRIGTTKTGTKIHRVSANGMAACGTETLRASGGGTARRNGHGAMVRTAQQPIGTTPEGALCGKCFAETIAPVAAAIVDAPVVQTPAEIEIARLEKAIKDAKFYDRPERRRETRETIAAIEAKIARIKETM